MEVLIYLQHLLDITNMAPYFSFVTKYIADVSQNNGNRPVAVRNFEQFFQCVIDHGGTFIESKFRYVDSVATNKIGLILCEVFTYLDEAPQFS